VGSEIDRIFEYWTRWKCLEVTPTTAPYFRANKPLYEERLKGLQKLSDEIIIDNLADSYRDSLLRQVFDSITILGKPDKNQAEGIANYCLAYAAGVVTGVIGKDILSSMNGNRNEEHQ
jgi:hypothetical protein